MPPAAAPADAGAPAPAPAKPAARKAPAKRKTPAKKDPKKRSVTPENGTGSDDDEESEDGKGGKTTDEVRRQRRMLSNRESARRSRRRKLEHVAVLDQQIIGHKAENAALVERLREMEQRVESVIRENAGLKAEVERLTAEKADLQAGRALAGSSTAGSLTGDAAALQKRVNELLEENTRLLKGSTVGSDEKGRSRKRLRAKRTQCSICSALGPREMRARLRHVV